MFPKDEGVFLGLKVHEHYDSGAQNTPSPLREIENFEKSNYSKFTHARSLT